MKKLLTLLAGSTLALYMQGCSDSGTSANNDNPFKASAGSTKMAKSLKPRFRSIRTLEFSPLTEKSLFLKVFL